MRLAILCEYFHPDDSGGTPTDMSDLARTLKARHPEAWIDVITSKNLYRSSAQTGALPRTEVWAGLAIKRLNTPKSNRPSMLLRLLAGGCFALAALLELLRRPRYDLVFIVTNPPALGGAAWLHRKLTGTPYLYLIHDLYPDIAVAMGKLGASSLLVRAFRQVQRWWMLGAGQVVVLGRCMKQHLLEVYSLSDGQVLVIPSWGAAAASRPETGANAFRRSLDFEGRVLLYAGNFSEYSNIDIFVHAAERLTHRRDILFVLIGDGARRAAVAEMIAAKKLTNIRLLPKVPRERMGEVLAACDVALVSLDKRMLGLGVPSKLYTILAAKRPILAIVPEASEVALVLKEEACGCNICPAEVDQLASAVERLIGSGPDLRQLGENAGAAVRDKYTIELAADRYWQAFAGLR
jgi:colanic acid biosynthesis glycosyl transferase WcaI